RTILASAYLDHTTPSIPTLLPYTTLFRSIAEQSKVISKPSPQTAPASRHAVLLRANVLPRRAARHEYSLRRTRQIHCRLQRQYRSEEHTSELQSRENLVCRLLLEKKKKKR